MTPEEKIRDLCNKLELPKLSEHKAAPLSDKWTILFIITGGVCFLTFFILGIIKDYNVIKKLSYLLCSATSMSFAFARQLYLRKQEKNVEIITSEKPKLNNLIEFPRNKS